MPDPAPKLQCLAAKNDEATVGALSTAPASDYEYYRPYTHPAHPLYNAWVKLPASLVQSLHVPAGFDACVPSARGPPLSLYHHLNHPIPFVDICGLVVGCESKETLAAWSVLVDDGSGIVLEALCKKAQEEEDQWKRGPRNGHGDRKTKIAGPGELVVPPVPGWKGRGWVNGEEVDTRLVEVGRILRVKGRLREWKGNKQVLVERICGCLRLLLTLYQFQLSSAGPWTQELTAILHSRYTHYS